MPLSRRCGELWFPSNIVEGQVRRSTKEFVQFLAHASDSLTELKTQLVLAADLGLAKADDARQLESELKEIQRMIAGIHRKLAARTLDSAMGDRWPRRVKQRLSSELSSLQQSK
jgi:hypothetical protein